MGDLVTMIIFGKGKNVGYSLFTIRYPLFTIYLFAIHYLPYTIRYSISLFAIRYSLFTTHYLFAIHYLLFTVRYLLFLFVV